MKLHSVSDEEQPPVYVPGISTERNFRARHLLKGQKVEVKAKVPAAAAPAPMDAWKSAGQAPGQQVPDKGGMKSASLKDLCPEDKRRIANLIKELASRMNHRELPLRVDPLQSFSVCP
uniref:protein hinderin-like isoform X1 n=1 Tax=Podarcis muralis TaxID=64176 RepID=UPI0010A05D62|nr:protein hinderin-like isoform X1 [Podarcis muralis]